MTPTTGRVSGKKVLITGAARGQGRSHALRLAEEGADLILVDLCADIATNDYPLASPEELTQTAAEVRGLGRRAVEAIADVRDRTGLAAAVGAGVAELGGLDVVVANAGICPLGDQPVSAFADAVDVDLVGVINTVHTALPHLVEGASIITIGSVAALLAAGSHGGPSGPGGAGYNLAKEVVDTYTRRLAAQLAPNGMRANVVHPTNVNTPMLQSAPMYAQFRPDLQAPTAQDAHGAFHSMQLMRTPWVEPEDVSAAVLFLASDEARFVTGHALTVDAGATLRTRR